MATPLESAVLHDSLIILGSAGLVIPAFARMRLNPALGFILIGIGVGPHGLGLLREEWPWLRHITIESAGSIATAAEIGIALLLFAIGLELSFERIRTMRQLILKLGFGQLLLSSAAITLALSPVMGGPPALAVALALALSSTALVLQRLAQKGQLLTTHGRACLSMLLFQDVALVPILFLLGVLAAGGEGATIDALGSVLLKDALAVAAIVVVGRFVLPPLFHQAARTRTPELFLAASLTVVIGASLITAAVGLSLVVGALLAGLLLAETEYRHEVEVTIAPFKGLLLGVFLISIGMSLDVGRVLSQPLLILGLLLALLVIKGAVVFVLMRMTRASVNASAQAALLMAPASETSMIVLTAALGARLVPPPAGDLALIVTALALTLVPLLGRIGEGLGRSQPQPAETPSVQAAQAAPVMVVGYGRVGQLVGSMLERHKVPYVAIDFDVDMASRHRQAGRPVVFGDGSRLQSLERLGLATARALVVTLDDVRTAGHLVSSVRAAYPDLQIIVRARDAEHAASLYQLGATDAVPETIESSLQLSEAVLVDLGVPMGPVIASIHEKRAEIRDEIQQMAPGRRHRPLDLGRRRMRDVAGDHEEAVSGNGEAGEAALAGSNDDLDSRKPG